MTRIYKLLFKYSVNVFLFLLVFSLFLNINVNAASGINQKINFQGKVVSKTSGTNVTSGDYDFIFRLYNSVSGSSPIWTENWNSGNGQVTVTDGIFSVALGTHTTFPSSVDFNSDNIYLSVEYNADGEMSPRVQFTAVPYAFNAQKVGGLTVTNTVGSTLTIADGKTITFGNSFTTTDVGITLDQNLATTASPTFAGLNITTGKAVFANGIGVTGNIDLNNNLNVGGTSYFAGNVGIRTAASSSYGLTVNNHATIDSIYFNSGTINTNGSDFALIGGGGQTTRNNIVLSNGAGGIALNAALYDEYYGSQNITLDLRENGGNILLNGGDVGIGTTNPSSKFQVSGSEFTTFTLSDKTTYYDDILTGPRILLENGAGEQALISSQSNLLSPGGTLQLQTYNNSGNLNDGITIRSSGKVGIGTINPNYNLDVAGDGGFSTNLNVGGTLTLSQGASDGYILTSDANGNARWEVGGATYTASVGLSLSDTNIFSIDYDSTLGITGNKIGLNLTNANTWTGIQTFSNGIGVGGTAYFTGNVGIGTTVPLAKLAVLAGDSNSVYSISESISGSNTFSDSGTAQNWKADDGLYSYVLPFVFPFFGVGTSNIQISTNGVLWMCSSCGTTSGYPKSTSLSTQKVIAPLWGDWNTNGSGQSGEDIYVDTSISNQITFIWKGEVFGYPTNTLNFSVTLYNTGEIVYKYGSLNTNLLIKDISNGMIAVSNGDGINYKILSISNQSSQTNTNNVTISSTFLGGNDTLATAFLVNSPATNFFTILNNGRVGIGTTNPIASLTINGDASINGELNMNNYYINNGIQPGDSNFVGYQAGLSASSASRSNFFGYQAGLSASSASNSNFFGYKTGVGASSASNSNFFGVNAGQNATGASYSNFFGYQAGQYSYNAKFSNFFGYQAGIGASYGAQSNFFGYKAGIGASSAINSNFFGVQAGQYATNAHDSNFFGYYAGIGASNAYSSNFFGSSAGIGASNAYSSNFFGPYAGQNATNAYRSNFFGYNAGVGASSAYQSNFFGHYAGIGASSAHDSNFLGINAGYRATSANTSNFFGQDAGYNATGANTSNFFGRAAGYNATSAYNSNFFGYAAGQSASNATNSNFFGYNAGIGASVAYQSNFFGINSGQNASGATNSNFFGIDAGRYAANASGSNFFGMSAGIGATNAADSNFFGILSGQYATSASYSNFFGYYAGSGATNAANAIFIGSYAGVNDAVNTGTTATAIAIGRYAGTGGYKDSIALGRGVINSADNQANFSNILYITGLTASDTQSATPVSIGKVGIGIATPSYNLDVLGNGHFSSNLNIDGTASFGGDINMNNFYITNGIQPGNSNFIGYQAGLGTNTASYSNFFGYRAGVGASNAGGSNFFGSNTGYYATGAFLSNFFGDSAGQYASSAYSSNFLGQGAGIGATNADNSNFLGQYAGRNVNNGSNSNFFGYRAGQYAANASNSNFIGYQAGQYSNNGYFSNFIGYQAGAGATNAANSIFIGSYAGYNDTVNTGTTATAIAIGRYAGTGGYKDSIALGRGVINSANNQANFGNILYMTGLGATDTQSATPISAGKIGIGTTTPTGKLTIVGSSGDGRSVSIDNREIKFRGDGVVHMSIFGPDTDKSYITFQNTSSNSITGTAGTDLLTILSDGKVGIGTAAPSQRFQITTSGSDSLQYSMRLQNPNNGTGGAATGIAFVNDTDANLAKGGLVYVAKSGYGQGDFLFLQNSNNDLSVADLSNAVMAITNNGNIGIGTTNPGYKLTVDGEPAANGYTAFTNYSDIRLKENVNQLDDGFLDKVMDLKPSIFNYNTLTGYDEETRNRTITGFIAQELQSIFPEMVGKTTINGVEYLDTNLSSLNIYLVKAIQELNYKVENKINDIQNLNGISFETKELKTSKISPLTDDLGNPIDLAIMGNVNVEGKLTAQVLQTSILNAGIINADKIAANQIEGLDIYTNQVDVLSQKYSDLKNQVDGLATSSAVLGTSTSDTQNNILAEFINNPLFKGISEFWGNIFFKGKVNFESSPTFNNQTAGYAIINANDDNVDIVFDTPLDDVPVVNVTMLLDTEDELNINNITNQDYSYFITKKSNTGFSIVLNKMAETDLKFSWSALVVKDIKTYQKPTPTPILIPTSTLVPTPILEDVMATSSAEATESANLN